VALGRIPDATLAATTLRWRSPSPRPAIVDAEAGSSSVRNRDQKDSVAEGEGEGSSVTWNASSHSTGFSAGSGGDHAVWVGFVARCADDGAGAASAGGVGCAVSRAATRSCKPACRRAHARHSSAGTAGCASVGSLASGRSLRGNRSSSRKVAQTVVPSAAA
jgi:hypothetical protein